MAAKAPGHEFVASGAGVEGWVELEGDTVTDLQARFELKNLAASDALGNRQLRKFLELDREPVAEATLTAPMALTGTGPIRFRIGRRQATTSVTLEGGPPSGRARFGLTFTGLGYKPPKFLFLKVADELAVTVDIRLVPVETA